MSNKTIFPFAETEVKTENKRDNETVGEYLKRVRQSCGHTLEEVAQVTKINLRYLEAIENDELAKLPGETFLQGFLRLYARFLCIDENEIIGKLKDIKRPGPHSLNVFSIEEYKKDNRKGLQLSPDNLKTILISAGGLIAILLLVFIFSSGRKSPTVQSSKNVYLKSPAPVEVKSMNSVAVTSQPVILKVSAKELTWIQVDIDGKDRKEMLMKPGEESSWKGDNKITIAVGNAGGVDMEVNGKKQEPLGKRGGVIRGVVVTSSGISK